MTQSFFSSFFLQLQKRIAGKVPEIRWVDMDLAQLENYQDRPPVAFPAILVDFTQTSYQQEMQQVQWGEVNLQLRLAFAPFSQSSNTAPQMVADRALQFFEIENRLYKALQGWSPDGDICQPLTRVSATTEPRNDALRVRNLIFSTAFEDSEAAPVYTKMPAELEENYENES